MTVEQMKEMGFEDFGKHLMLSDRASYYNCANIRLGDNVRIDDFCVIAAGQEGIEIGSNVHVAVFCSLIGRAKIKIEDFAGLSSRVSVYSSSDDYSGAALTNPTVPPEFTNVRHAEVNIGRHVIIGAGSVVLPGVRLEDGVAVGALSLVRKNCGAFGVYMGIPAERIGERKRDLLKVEKTFLTASGAD